ncbi:hypothetical protein [Microbacterium saperdae]|uniref:hypothetical protein n=1 Tax=Microbacterium saperdae TaxID=69368 RepID=UPI00114FD646|nr:hypothetical protein [Microbacterium saperdae]
MTALMIVFVEMPSCRPIAAADAPAACFERASSNSAAVMRRNVETPASARCLPAVCRVTPNAFCGRDDATVLLVVREKLLDLIWPKLTCRSWRARSSAVRLGFLSLLDEIPHAVRRTHMFRVRMQQVHRTKKPPAHAGGFFLVLAP